MVAMPRKRRTRIIALLAATTAALAISSAAAVAQTTTPSTEDDTTSTDDDVVLVSNIDLDGTLQDKSSIEWHQYAQAFTTGDNTDDYTLTKIEIGAWGYYPHNGNSALTAASFTVSVRADNNGKPGTSLAETTAALTKATSSTDHSNTATATLDDALALTAGTQYWIVYGGTDNVTWTDMVYGGSWEVSYRREYPDSGPHHDNNEPDYSGDWVQTSDDTLSGWSLSGDLLGRENPGWTPPGSWLRITGYGCNGWTNYFANNCSNDLHGIIELTGQTGGTDRIGGV